MIKETDARDILEKNLERTQSLISAMEKIDAYNRIYQDNIHQLYSNQFLENPTKDEDLESKRYKSIQSIYTSVKDAQDRELKEIKISCGEHAIISLTTAYETYYKELAQELIHSYPGYFAIIKTSYTERIQKLAGEVVLRDYEDIGKTLNLSNRWHYYKFFDAYSISFLSFKERDFIEKIYLKRNIYVHNAGKEDKRSQKKMAKLGMANNDLCVSTEAKKLHTQFKKMMIKTDENLRLKFIEK